MSELQVTFVPMSLGIDESSRPEHAQGALEILNATQAQRGGLTKTPGYELLSTNRADGGTRSVGYRQFVHSDTPCTIDGVTIDSWNETDTTSIAVGVDAVLGQDAPSRVPVFRMTTDPVFGVDGADPKVASMTSSTVQASWWDWCVCGNIGVAVYAYISSAGTRRLGAVAWVIATGQVFWSNGLVATASVYATARGNAAKLAVCGSSVLLAYEDGTATTINITKMDCTSVATAMTGFSGGLAISDWNQTDFAIAGVDASYAFLAYDATGTGRLKLARIDVSGLTVAQSSTTATTGGSISGVAVAVNGSACWAVWGKSASAQTWVCTVDITDVSVATGTATAVATHTNDSVHLGVTADTATHAWIVGCDGAGSATANMFSAPVEVVAGTPGLVTAKAAFKLLAPVSQPLVVDSRAYVWAFLNTQQTSAGGNPRNGQRTVFLVDITDDQTLAEDLSAYGPVVHALPWPRVSVYGGFSLGSVTAIPIHSGPKMFTLATGESAMLLPRLSSSVNVVFDLVRLDSTHRHRWATAHMNGTTHVAGPVLCEYDGRRTYESNFVHRPVVSMGSTGAGTFTGNWGCTAIYEHVDSAGNVHWSAPADAVTINVTNKVSIDWTVYGALTRRGAGQSEQLRIALYRTTSNGSVYYRLTTLDNPTTSTGLATYTDSVADATLDDGQTLYGTTALPGTLGAAQPRVAPAGLLVVWRHNNRLMGIGHDRHTVWYSAELVDGEGTWWSDAFRISVGSRRKLVAGASQDGTLVLFSDQETFVVVGDGPPENGGNGTEFSTPRAASTDVGCINPLAVVTTSDGTMFQSLRGIEILTKSFAVEWIGEPVAQTLASFPYISSAVVDQKNALVLFHCHATSSGGLVTGSGVTLVYDLTLKQWQKERYLESSNAGIPVQDGCIAEVDGETRRHIMRPSGAVYRQKSTANVSAYLDATNTWRTMRVGSPWFAVAGKSGEGWIRRLELMFERHTNHDLAISFYYDDSTSAEETITRTAQQIVDAGGRLDILPTRQRCRTFRVQVEDATPTSLSVGSGKGSTIYGLALAYEPMSGQERRPSTSR